MLDLHVEKIGELAVVDCAGRIVQSEAAFKLRETVISLRDARTIVLDLSDVSAIEGGGLGMLMFLQRWANYRGIELRLFNPTISVRDRLDRAGSRLEFDIATARETMALLASADNHSASIA